MQRNRPLHAVLGATLALAIAGAVGIAVWIGGKREPSPGTSQDPDNQQIESAGTAKASPLQELRSRVQPKSVPVLREEAVNTRLEAKNGMRRDADGEMVLEGVGKDADAFQMHGTVSGTIKREDTGELVAHYSFRVMQILPGKSERMADCFLRCQGTYWIPGPSDADADDRTDWESVPPTIAECWIPPSGIGLMFRAEEGGDAERAGSARQHRKTGFVLSGSLVPLFFGAGSLLEPVPAPKIVPPVPTPREMKAKMEREIVPTLDGPAKKE